MIESLANELEEVMRAADWLKSASTFPVKGNLTTALEDVNMTLEQATITSRIMLERLYPNDSLQNSEAPQLPYLNISGSIQIVEYNWLYIKLNTLLPHCRYQPPEYLIDTITRLLNMQETKTGKLPRYNDAMMIIDEHCNIESRNAFDSDNKGWKAIPNVLKGRVIPDDDQFTLDVALLSKQSENISCNIFILDTNDAEFFFNLRSNGLLYLW